MIIIVGCNKGGAGKTTTSTNLSVGLSRLGKDVCLVDADPQRSASRWHQDRELSSNELVFTMLEKRDNISKTLIALNEKYDCVVVDVAGRNSREMITGLAVADVLIAPHQSSQLDLDTLVELEQQAIRIKDLNPKLEILVYQAMASTNPSVKANERTEFLDYVRQFEGFVPLDSIGYYRKAYKDVIPLGLSVLEYENDSAKEEITSLISEVFNDA